MNTVRLQIFRLKKVHLFCSMYLFEASRGYNPRRALQATVLCMVDPLVYNGGSFWSVFVVCGIPSEKIIFSAEHWVFCVVGMFLKGCGLSASSVVSITCLILKLMTEIDDTPEFTSSCPLRPAAPLTSLSAR